MTNEILQTLAMAMQRRMASMPQRLRPYTTSHDDLPRALLLTGSRGCGKSTFLLHHARTKRILYLSADNPKIMDTPLYDVVSDILMKGYEGVIIDEVHYAADWSIHLKALYDDFPDKTFWVSDSSSLILRAGEADLSRRYMPMEMPLMSFREYLFLEAGEIFPVYHPGDLNLPAQPTSTLLQQFLDYRSHGTRPFYQDGNFPARYMAVLDKVLNNDIPFFLPRITENNLRLMRAIIGTLSNSSVPRVQITSLCADWGIGAEKLYQLLFVMESVGLLRIVRMQNDTKARSIGAKMLFADPCAYHVLDADQGTEREAYIANCFAMSGYEVFASRNETKGDYVVTKGKTNWTLEVGGKNKKPKQADFVLRDDTDYPAGNAIPFWLAGMMW